jgi:hypothetical protein
MQVTYRRPTVTLPRLENWFDTRLGLHRAAQVVGGVRRAVATPEPNWTHLGLGITPQGVTTGMLPNRGSLDLHFADRSIVFNPLQGDQDSLLLDGHTQLSLTDALESLLCSSGHEVKIDRGKITSADALSINPAQAADYAQTLMFMGDMLARFRESLPGEKSPLVVWPHGFDASFLWFAGEATEKKPHLSFGFSPGSEGFAAPYLYFYAWPQPEDITALPLPHHARWFQGAWTGLVLDYPALIAGKNPDAAIIETFQTVYNAIAPRLKESSNAQ